MRMIKLCVLIISLPLCSIAQTKEEPAVKRYFTHTHGISYQKFDNMNNRIKMFPQYEQLKNTTGTLQLGLITERKKTIFNYLLQVGTSLSGDNKKKSTATRYTGFAFDLGYYIYKGNRFSVYPMAGLGIVNFKLVLNRDNTAVPFDSVINSPTVRQNVEPLKLANRFITYRLGAGGNITSKRHPRNSFGLQAGYVGSFKDEEWRVNTTQILANSPNDKLSQIYVHLLLRYELR